MANLFFNSDNLNSDKSLVIENIPIDSTVANQLETLSSLVVSGNDLNGDGNNDLLVQPSLLVSENNLTQDNFIIFGGDSLPSTINPTEIDGSNGFILDNAASLASGFADINGDEFDDLILTSISISNSSTSSAVILSNNQFPATVDINELNGTNGFKFSSNEDSLIALAVRGDINNDSINDFVLISTRQTEESIETESKIVFGRESYDAEFDVSTLDGTNGFAVDDSAIVSGTGVDLNADEFDDLVFYNQTNPISYVVYGRNQFDAELDLSILTANLGFTITQEGSNQSDRLLSGIYDDINGDGIGDIIVQKQIASETEEGELQADRVFVVYGNSENTATNVDLASLDGSNGFTFNTNVELQTILDINGDNKQDLFLKNLTDNKTYVVFGSDNLAANFDLSTLDGTNGFVIENANIANITDLANLNVIGDLNGDEIDDISLDIEGDNSYILLGSQEAFPASIDLTDPNTNAIEISGSRTTNGIAGFSDLNNDGADEIIFNSVADTENDSLASSTVVFGDADLSFTTNEPPENPDDSERIELFRFRNTSFESGTYVFVGAAERDAILADEDLSNTFALDGRQENGTVNPAFTASLTALGDDSIPLYRLKSLDVPGTFLFVSTEEYEAIFAENSNQRDKWQQEGLDGEGNDIADFYLLDGSADRGVEFNRFQNTQNNTFLYAGPEETETIENDPNLSSLFINQGVAFESLA
jgi:hypothetical protein